MICMLTCVSNAQLVLTATMWWRTSNSNLRAPGTNSPVVRPLCFSIAASYIIPTFNLYHSEYVKLQVYQGMTCVLAVSRELWTVPYSLYER